VLRAGFARETGVGSRGLAGGLCRYSGAQNFGDHVCGTVRNSFVGREKKTQHRHNEIIIYILCARRRRRRVTNCRACIITSQDAHIHRCYLNSRGNVPIVQR